MRLSIIFPTTAALAVLALSACGEDESPPSPLPATPEASTAQPAPSATPAPTIPAPATLSPTPTPAFTAPQTEDQWVRERLAVVANLYDLSDEGRDLLDRLDVRQMRGQPGFFGSYGYKSWTGVGEAKPSTIMHELGHAYWGAFPVTGLPELSWEPREGQPLSPAMERYHRDVLDFMRQPPGHYELFRSRLRNIPELSEDKLGGLIHSVEADVVYNIGGDLELIPPILRKYWDRLLRPGPWLSWYEAVAWFQSVSDDDRAATGQLMGFEHLDLRAYTSLPRADDAHLPEDHTKLLGSEERQRLWDFADQFDLLLGEPEYQENFGFWRRYLGTMKTLHGRHAGFLDGLTLPNAPAIADALDLLLDLDGRPSSEKARLLAESAAEDPFVLHFLPTLDNGTLLALSAMETPLLKKTLKGTAAFVQRLETFNPVVEAIMAAARDSTQEGAAALTRFLDTQKNREDLKLFLGLFRDADHARARAVTAALSDDTVIRVLKTAPAELRSLLNPEKLLDALTIAAASTPEELSIGIDLLVTYPSGNFRIDEPYLDALYDVMAARVDADPGTALDVIAGTEFPIGGFIRKNPKKAVAALAADLDTAARLIRESDAVIFPPARFVYRLIGADPDFAALLVAHLDRLPEKELVIESLAHFAYDADRLAAVPGLPISLENDGRFLAALLLEKGAAWLKSRLRDVVQVYEPRIARGDLPTDLLAAHRRTLVSAVATLPDGPPKRDLAAMVDAVLHSR
jgi:hypothetical protein